MTVDPVVAIATIVALLIFGLAVVWKTRPEDITETVKALLQWFKK